MPARILCIGDSLVRGDEANGGGHRSFRGPLQSALATAGVSFDFVGPESLTPAFGGSDPHHAGFAGAGIDTTIAGVASLTSRLAALKTAHPTIELLVIYVGWVDLYTDATNIANRYETFLGAVQSGVWASTPAVIATLHPEPGQTQAQTNGSRTGYQALNDRIRSLASATRLVVDLAGLTGGASREAWVAGMLFDALNAPDFRTVGDEALPVAAPLGGNLGTSFASIAAFNALWSRTPPFSGNSGGGANLQDFSVEAVDANGVNRHTNNVASVIPWLWMYALAGHRSSNTVIRARNMYAGALRTNGTWGWFFQGGRPGAEFVSWLGRDDQGARVGPGHLIRDDPDGISTLYRMSGAWGIEVWPRDTVPSRGVLVFNGGFNRDLMVNARCFIYGAQVQLALLDPNGPNDIALARYGAACGCDFGTPLGGRHYDRYGWPYNISAGGHDRWKRLANTTEWQWVTGITLGSNGTGNPDHHWWDPGLGPPAGDWNTPTTLNDIPTYSVSAADIRANPPPLPAYVAGNAAGWTITDYWPTPSGVRDIHWTAAGADKAAQAISARIVASGLLSGNSTNPDGTPGTPGEPVIPPALLPGLPTQPNVFLRLTGSNQTVGLRSWSTGAGADAAPVWGPSTGVIRLAQGASAASVTLSASGQPAPTYSIVSGPSWLGINSATGALTGTVPLTESESVAVFRATNTSGSADRTETVVVSGVVGITTTTLPAAIQGQPYLAPIEVTGPEPLTLTASGLPAGLALVGRNIVGTPTNAAGGSVLLTLTPSTGAAVTRTIVVAGGVASDLPAITTASLPDGTVGLSYSQPLAATGAGPITWSVASGTLPPGLAIAGSVVAGTPAAPGGYGVRLRATNALGVAERDITININAAGAVAPIASPWARWTRN